MTLDELEQTATEEPIGKVVDVEIIDEEVGDDDEDDPNDYDPEEELTETLILLEDTSRLLEDLMRDRSMSAYIFGDIIQLADNIKDYLDEWDMTAIKRERAEG